MLPWIEVYAYGRVLIEILGHVDTRRSNHKRAAESVEGSSIVQMLLSGGGAYDRRWTAHKLIEAADGQGAWAAWSKIR